MQELLSNAIKHAQASAVELGLEMTNKQLLLDYKNNGIGFSRNKDSKPEALGIGMVTMDARVKRLKGIWKLESQPGKGTSAKFSFPVKEIR